MTLIDYTKIAESIAYYKDRGYKYIEVPWLISRESLDITRPPQAKPFETFAGDLVASAEQSLLHIREQLEPNQRYVCASPCFRDEIHDELHRLYFFKVELMHVKPVRPLFDLPNMIEEALNFFKFFTCKANWVTTDMGFDIEIGGVEVGSYGYRQYEDFGWIYGTGCAEPRLTQSLDLLYR